MKRARLLLPLPALLAAHPPMPGMTMPGMMPGMAMPDAKPAAPRPAAPAAHRATHKAAPHPATAPMPAMPGMPAMASGGESVAPPTPTPGAALAPPAGTDLPAGHAPPPPAWPGRAADRFYDPAAMAAAAARLRADHGAMTFHQLLLSLAEYQGAGRAPGYRWDGEAWLGGDVHRLVLKSEGEGQGGGRAERAEAQALYSRALDPYWNLQIGLRQDFAPSLRRTYAVLGVEGLAPYWLKLDGALFLSQRGEALARLSISHDLRLAQRLVLQPRIEANLAAQTIRAEALAAGLSEIETGLRLRYELRREFAPYLGVSWTHRRGRWTDPADAARAAGRADEGARLVAGVRAWL